MVKWHSSHSSCWSQHYDYLLKGHDASMKTTNAWFCYGQCLHKIAGFKLYHMHHMQQAQQHKCSLGRSGVCISPRCNVWLIIMCSHDFFQKESLLEMFLAGNSSYRSTVSTREKQTQAAIEGTRSCEDANSYRSQLQAATRNERWIVVTMTGVDGSITNKR